MTREDVQKAHEVATQLKYAFLTERRRYREALDTPIFTPEHEVKIAELKTRYHASQDAYNRAAATASLLSDVYHKACGQTPDHRENVYAEHAKKR